MNLLQKQSDTLDLRIEEEIYQRKKEGILSFFVPLRFIITPVFSIVLTVMPEGHIYSSFSISTTTF